MQKQTQKVLFFCVPLSALPQSAIIAAAPFAANNETDFSVALVQNLSRDKFHK